MTKYIKPKNKSKSKYYSFRYIKSFATKIIGVIGARGIGKTYGTKKYLIKKFLNEGKKFIWIRDTESACDELAYNDGEKFFVDVKKEFDNLEGKIQGYIISINDKHCGYLMPASTYYNYKGNSFEECSIIVFDEFIPESGQRNCGNRVRQFINTISTIGRLRTDYEIILLANSLNRGNGILGIFDINIKDYGVYINRDKNIALHYVENSDNYNKAQEESLAGKIIKGTIYEEQIMNNNFNDDISMYFEKLPPKSKVCTIICDNFPFRIYEKNGIFYCKEDNYYGYDKLRVVVNQINANTKYPVINKFLLNELKKAHSESRMYFSNANIYNEFISLFL